MQIGEICTRDVVSATRDTPVFEAARLMRSRHVGNVVVVGSSKRGPVPVGVVTDLDIVVGIIASRTDVTRLTLGAIMGRNLITILETQDVFETLEHMQHHGVRRVPVTDKEGVLLGIVSIDDLWNYGHPSLRAFEDHYSRAEKRDRSKAVSSQKEHENDGNDNEVRKQRMRSFTVS